MNTPAASFNEVWLDTLRLLTNTGEQVEVRGTKTFELLGHHVCFPMCYSILTIPGRKLSYDFMFTEAWWILTGRNRVLPLLKTAPSYAKFSDDGHRLAGAYGPKIVDQISYVVECLRQDPRSRQAVINIWRERPGPSRDIPCTLSVQFMIRGSYICCFVNMRSNDVWLGMPYDVFTMTMLAMQVGLELCRHTGHHYQLGTMHHYAASRHIYFRDIEKIKSVLQMETHFPAPLVDEGHRVNLIKVNQYFEQPDDFLDALRLRARSPENLTEQDLTTLPWLSYGLPNAG